MRWCAAVLLATCLAVGPALAQDRPSLLQGGQAAPSFLGGTGLLLTPSAYTVGDRGGTVFAYGSSRFSSFGVVVGPHERLELGATFLDFRAGACCGDKWIGSAKALLVKEKAFLPAFSVGVTDFTDEIGLDPGWYVVASKDLSTLTPFRSVPLRAHVGFGDGIFNLEPFAGLELDLGRPVAAPVVGGPRFSGIAEYINRDVNLGLRGRYRGFSATVSLFDFSRIGGGIAYTTGLRL